MISRFPYKKQKQKAATEAKDMEFFRLYAKLKPPPTRNSRPPRRKQNGVKRGLAALNTKTADFY